MKKYFLLSLFFSCSLAWSSADDALISGAIFKHNHLNQNDSKFTVAVEKIYGEFGKASISPENGESETETVYLKKTESDWEVVIDQGTGVDPSALNLPKQIW